METEYFIGLGLGQLAEYTALAVPERTAEPIPHSNLWAWHYAVRPSTAIYPGRAL